MHTITKAARYDIGVVRESLGRVSARPATHFILERLGQIPVIKGGEWLHTGCQQAINQSIIKIEARGIDLSPACRKYAWPGNREAIGVYSQVAHDLHVFRVAMIVIDSYQTAVIIQHLARRWRCGSIGNGDRKSTRLNSSHQIISYAV